MTDESFTAESSFIGGEAPKNKDIAKRLKKALCRIVIGVILTGLSLIYFAPMIKCASEYPASVDASILAVTDKTKEHGSRSGKEIDDDNKRVYLTVNEDKRFGRRLVYVDDSGLADSYYSGDTDVKVFYDPDDPKDFKAVSINYDLRVIGWGLLCLGGLFLLFGLLRLIFALRAQAALNRQASMDELELLNRSDESGQNTEFF